VSSLSQLVGRKTRPSVRNKLRPSRDSVAPGFQAALGTRAAIAPEIYRAFQDAALPRRATGPEWTGPRPRDHL